MSIKNESVLKITKEIGRLLERNRLAFIIILFLIISGYFINLYKDSLFKTAAQWMVHSEVVKDEISTIQSQQKEIGLVVREFILMPDPDCMLRYKNTWTALWKNVDSLQRLTSDNAEQQNQIISLRRYFREDAVITNSIIIISNLHTAKAGYAPMLQNEIALSDSIRTICNLMSANENKLLQERARIFQAASLQSSIFSAFRFLLTLAIIILSYRMLTKELKRRKDTEHKLLMYENELKQKIDELNRSNEELEQFAFIASHDMQEPIRKITAFSDRLKLKYQDSLDETGQLYLEKIQNAAIRMFKLMRDLLEFSRISNSVKTDYKTDLNTIIQEVVQDLEASISQQNAIIESEKLPTVNADPAQMNRLFANLIGNALKFSKQNVLPKIRIVSEEVPGTEADLNREDNYYKISVSDNGIGFDEVNRERIFTIFKRLHGRSEYEGSGIGLAICKRIVSNYKGAIRAFSKINEGSTFVVYLPKD